MIFISIINNLYKVKWAGTSLHEVLNFIQIAPGHTVARHRGCGAWRLPPPLLQLLHRHVGIYRDMGHLSPAWFWQIPLPYSNQKGEGRLCPPIRSPICLESFRCAYYTTPSVGWDIQEVRFHCNFSFRQVYKSSCIITI